MTAEIIYKGQLRTDAQHIKSSTQIETDAPVDNMGKGERFSPSDLLAVALGTCIITTMAIKTLSWEIPLEGTKLEVTKIMAQNPRRVGEVKINISFPETLQLDDKQRQILQNIVHTCPVAQSLHPDLLQNVTLNW